MKVFDPYQNTSVSQIWSQMSWYVGNEKYYQKLYPKTYHIIVVAKIYKSTISEDTWDKIGLYANERFHEVWIANHAHHSLRVQRNYKESAYSYERIILSGCTASASFPEPHVNIDEKNRVELAWFQQPL